MVSPALQLNTITIKDAALADKFSWAAACGYGALEMWAHDAAPHLMTEADWKMAETRFLVGRAGESRPGATMETVSRLAGEHGVSVAGLIPGIDVLMRWHDSLDEDMLESLADTIDACADLGGRYFVLPVLGEGGSLQGTADNLKRIAQYAVPKGIRLGLEPMGHIKKCGRLPEALETLELSGLGAHAGLVVDCFHFFRAGQDISSISALQAGQIVMVHLNDALDLPLGELVGNKHRAYPGHGIFDVVGFCRAILETGYVGPFTTEIMNEAYWADDPETVCHTCFTTTRTALDAAVAQVS